MSRLGVGARGWQAGAITISIVCLLGGWWLIGMSTFWGWRLDVPVYRTGIFTLAGMGLWGMAFVLYLFGISQPLNSARWREILHHIAAACLFTVLLAHVYIGSFTRFIADDYVWNYIERSEGFMGSQRYWYINATGRFSSTLVVGVVSQIGPEMARYLPMVILCLWFGVTMWSLTRINVAASLGLAWLERVSLALLTVYTILASLPNVVQNLYWLTGTLTYTMSLMLLTLYLGLGAAYLNSSLGKGRALYLLLSWLLAFVAAGFQETYLALQTAALGLGILACTVFASAEWKRRLLPFLIAGLAGSLTAAVTIVLSPGTHVRQSVTGPSATWPKLIELTYAYTNQFLREVWARARWTTALSLLFPAWLTFSQPGESSGLPLRFNLRGWVLVAMLLLVAVYTLIYISFLPSTYIFQAYPADRVIEMPQFVLTSFLILLGVLCGRVLRQIGVRRYPIARLGAVGGLAIIILALLVLGPIASARQTYAWGPTVTAYAAFWDARDQAIRTARAQGFMDLVVEERTNMAQLETLHPEPDFMLNRFTALYYGLRSITTR